MIAGKKKIEIRTKKKYWESRLVLIPLLGTNSVLSILKVQLNQ
jgi:hypothetical protein